jgi:hypothetical protein
MGESGEAMGGGAWTVLKEDGVLGVGAEMRHVAAEDGRGEKVCGRNGGRCARGNLACDTRLEETTEVEEIQGRRSVYEERRELCYTCCTAEAAGCLPCEAAAFLRTVLYF